MDTRLVDVELVDGVYLVSAPRLGVRATVSAPTFEEAIEKLRAAMRDERPA